MFVKRLILSLITVLAILSVTFSLIKSFSEPQIQSKLELYQTNLILNASELAKSSDLTMKNVLQTLGGENPLKTAETQYIEAIKNDEKIVKQLETELNNNQNKKLEQLTNKLNEVSQVIDELNLRLGVIYAQQSKLQDAEKTWQLVINNNSQLSSTGKALINLFQEKEINFAETEKLINYHLEKWFRYQTLSKLYQVTNHQTELLALQQKAAQISEQAIFKLVIIGAIPFLGSLIGVGILIFSISQWIIYKLRSENQTETDKLPVLVFNNTTWETSWDGEIIWQVLIAGFFFISQVFLPLVLTIFKQKLPHLDTRGEAIFILISYLLMSGGSIGVLYLSIKQFFPLSENWFKFEFKITSFLWGFGGYMTAIPLVIVVSLINQQIWQGQGGSNPILSIALENNDMIVLGIFFITAAILAPIFEEILFRGFLLASLTKYLPNWGAIALSSLIFAIAHLSPSEILPLTTLGMVLAFVYTKTKNLLSPMLLHCLWNTGTLLSLFLLGS